MRHFLVAFLVMSVALAGPRTAAAAEVASSKPAAPASGGLQIPKGTLGPEYLDASFGFALRPLAGARMDRRKRTVEGQVVLAQFVRLEIGWSMSVRLWAAVRQIDVGSAREAMKAALIAEYPDLQVTSAEPIQVAAREGVRLLGTFSNAGQMWIRQEAVIPLRNKDHALLILVTPADDREVATKTFDQVLESFKIPRTELQQQQLDEALQRGTGYLQQLTENKRLGAVAADKPLWMRLSRDGKSLGFISVHERATTLEGEPGVQIQQQAWVFNSDDSVQFVQEDKFVAANLSVDEWRIVSQVMPSKAVDPKQKLVVSVEGGIRRQDKLVVEYNTQLGVADKQSKVIEVQPSYAPMAWPMLLPRVVDLDKPELYAFSMYDTERCGLVLRTFRVAGPTQVLVGGRRVSAHKIEDSEGSLPPVSEIDVDDHGTVLRIVSGPVETVAVTQDQIEQEFGSRVRAIQAQFRENNPPPANTTQAPKAQPGQAGKPRPSRGSKNPSSANDSRRANTRSRGQ